MNDVADSKDLAGPSPVGRIRALFARHGAERYDGSRREPVTALEHALQCAQLAEWAHAAPTLIAAALLHDVGHFLIADGEAMGDDVDDEHDMRAAPMLAAAFGPAVAEPVRLHVAAKRFLVHVDPGYTKELTPASVHSLALQGGPMSDAEAAAFLRLPWAEHAVQLRRWDDLAKEPRRPTPPLDVYLALLEGLRLLKPLRPPSAT
ncbi:MAG TPA: HD domain-containing protein [Burkholderiaceae bacterium]|nr:HD domain-containing protein [Burkholderiaceae bacterium]